MQFFLFFYERAWKKVFIPFCFIKIALFLLKKQYAHHDFKNLKRDHSWSLQI